MFIKNILWLYKDTLFKITYYMNILKEFDYKIIKFLNENY